MLIIHMVHPGHIITNTIDYGVSNSKKWKFSSELNFDSLKLDFWRSIFIQLNLHEPSFDMSLFQYFWRFAQICKKFAAFEHKIVCYCFWTILGEQLAKLFRNNNKNTFVLICCKFLANLSKSYEILKQYDVKWRFNYRKCGSVWYSFSCTCAFSWCMKYSSCTYNNVWILKNFS